MLTNEENIEELTVKLKTAERRPAMHAIARASEKGAVVSSISAFTLAVSDAAEKYGKPVANFLIKLPEDDDNLNLLRLIEIKNTTSDEMERTMAYKDNWMARRRVRIRGTTAASDCSIAQRRPLPRPKRAVTAPYFVAQRGRKYTTKLE